MVLFQRYAGDIVKQAMRTPEQQQKFNRCMCSMHLWYGNAHMHIWMLTKVPECNLRNYYDRGW